MVATRRQLPEGGAAEVPTSGVAVEVGGLPVSATAMTGADGDVLSEARNRPSHFVSGPARVRVEVAHRGVTTAAGFSGVLLSVSQVDTAANSSVDARVTISLDYQRFADLFGASFGQRLRLVALPPCALTTPHLRQCQTQTNLSSATALGRLSAEVTLPTVLAAVSGANSAGATFEASSLSATYSWSAGGQGGGFSVSYPLPVPASLGGPVPRLAITYDSGSVDYNRNTASYLISMPQKTISTTVYAATQGDADYLGGSHAFYDGATGDATPSQGLLTRTTELASVIGGAKT